jgi:tetratricopeptide (TPR) repeat protein
LGEYIGRKPDIKFLPEILWLYEQAREDYEEALALDPTETECYLGLYSVLNILGKGDESAKCISKALAILNRAIDVDNADVRSYSQRAEIFEQLGHIDLAISDLERLLSLTIKESSDIKPTRERIEKLRGRMPN